jgi:hypothetical protein
VPNHPDTPQSEELRTYLRELREHGEAIRSATHRPDCRWQQTTPGQCEYRQTHHYCPHAEHACTCLSPPDTPAPAEGLTLDDVVSALLAEARHFEQSDGAFDGEAARHFRGLAIALKAHMATLQRLRAEHVTALEALVAKHPKAYLSAEAVAVLRSLTPATAGGGR